MKPKAVPAPMVAPLLLLSLSACGTSTSTTANDGKTTYKVDWQDYATGALITAQMTAGKRPSSSSPSPPRSSRSWSPPGTPYGR